MNSEIECSLWQGRPVFWQEQALIALVEDGREIRPWSWVTATCGELCLNCDHLVAESPQSLVYPPGQCVYCGLVAQSKDHLIPTNWTGREGRARVLTVPACLQCNSAIGDTPVFAIDKRRAIAQAHISRKYRKVLARPDYSNDDLMEFEGRLRQAVKAGLAEKQSVRDRLSWPDDPYFDLRYLQKSGIDDPYVTGLLSPPDGV